MRVAFFASSVLVLALIGLTASQAPKIVDNARLAGADSDTSNWLMYGRTYDDHRFSPLKQINEQTIGRLGLMWSRELAPREVCKPRRSSRTA
jgi:quinohemoprotein ethanol dehydrogenase